MWRVLSGSGKSFMVDNVSKFSLVTRLSIALLQNDFRG